MQVNVTALPSALSLAVQKAAQDALRSPPSVTMSTVVSAHVPTTASIVQNSVVQATQAIAGTSGDRVVQGNIPWNGRIPNASSREPSAQELVAQLNELLNSSLTSGSQKAYQRAWTCYRQFHARFYSDCETQLIPVSIDALALFISYLSCKKLAVATIHSYVSRLRGIGDPMKSFLIQKLLMKPK